MPDTPEPQSAPILAFLDGSVCVVIDTRVYRMAAVQKAAYRMADKCTVVVGGVDDHRLPIRLTFRSGTTEEQALVTARLFFQELLDQELREQVGGETRAMRDLILAHAFSRTDLVRRE